MIENYDIMLIRSETQKSSVWKYYKRFLFAVLFYYLTDVTWGMLESFKLSLLLFIDTTVYFCAMALGVFFWTGFVISYLREKNHFQKFLLYFGRIFLAIVLLIVTINCFYPVLFSVDDQCVYHAYSIRYAILISQIILLVMTSIHTFICMTRSKSNARNRYRTIAMFGLIMAFFLFAQLWFPYLPLYCVAYLLGICLLRTFVVNDEKNEYKEKLEKAFEREKHHFDELRAARAVAYRDPLTGVKSKAAYIEAEEKKDKDISDRQISEFAVAVFDLNGLKETNDKYGHEKGDLLIKEACQIICRQFKHSPVFRIGGDEFVALLEGSDYENRVSLKKSFDLKMACPADDKQVIVAMGMSDYVDGDDLCMNDVFIRADKRMYDRKRELKLKKS